MSRSFDTATLETVLGWPICICTFFSENRPNALNRVPSKAKTLEFRLEGSVRYIVGKLKCEELGLVGIIEPAIVADEKLIAELPNQ
jgi:hypothetical protein